MTALASRGCHADRSSAARTALGTTIRGVGLAGSNPFAPTIFLSTNQPFGDRPRGFLFASRTPESLTTVLSQTRIQLLKPGLDSAEIYEPHPGS